MNKRIIAVAVVIVSFGSVIALYNQSAKIKLNTELNQKQYELEQLQAELDNPDYHQYSFEGFDSGRIEADKIYMNKVFSDILTFSNGEEFLEAKDMALNLYNLNENFVDIYYDESGLYDVDGNVRTDINLKYDEDDTEIYLVGDMDSGRYYHYMCDIYTYSGNYVKDGTAGLHIFADILLNENQTGSITLYNPMVRNI